MEDVRLHSSPASGPPHRTGYLRWVSRGTTLLVLFGLGVAVGPALHRWLTDRESIQAWVLALGP